LSSTLADIDQEPYYTEALINNKDFSCNSSPTFNSAKGPIVRACTAEKVVYAMNPSEKDGDKIRYSFINPRATPSVNTIYKNGFSATKPVAMTGDLSINSNGDITINATTPDQKGMTDIKVSEYRNGKLAGYTIRGIQISTFDCDNKKPKFLGFEGGETTLTICAGDTLTNLNSMLKGVDTDGDNVRFKILSFTKVNGNPSTNPLRVYPYSDTARLYFDWRTQGTDTGTYIIQVSLEDNGCPTPRSEEGEYRLRIIPLPFFDLGLDRVLTCTNPTIIDPQADIAELPAQYNWTTTTITSTDTIIKNFSNDKTHTVPKSQAIELTITDAVGCSARDSVFIIDPLENKLEIRKFCDGLTTNLIDSSTTVQGNIIRRKWTVQTSANNFGNVPFVTHKFPGVGAYSVTLEVENSDGCIKIGNYIINICGKRELGIQLNDHCSKNNGDPAEVVIISDSTALIPYLCRPVERTWTISRQNTSGGFDPLIMGDLVKSTRDVDFGTYRYAFPDSGYYKIELNTLGFSGCVDQTDTIVRIDPTPEINLLVSANFGIKCNKPDTVLTAVINPLAQGTPSLYFNQLNPVKISVNDTLKVTANSPGLYTFYIEDSLGCEYTKYVTIVHPARASFVYDTVCTIGNPMNFTNNSSSSHGIVSYKWHFGDGDSSEVKEPSHIYAASGDYSVSLEITDSAECTSKMEYVVYNKVLDTNAISLFPDLLIQKICVNDLVQVTSPKLDGIRTVDTIAWNLGNGTNWQFYYNQFFPLTPKFVSAGYEQVFKFQKADTINIQNYVVYNAHPSVHSHSCKRIFDYQEEIIVAPAFNGDIQDNKLCVGDTSEFVFVRNVNDTIPVVSWDWKFYEFSNFIPYDSTKKEIPKIYTSENLISNGNNRIKVRLRAIDTLGCVFDNYIELGKINDRRASFTILEIPKGWVDYTGHCVSTPININLHSDKDADTEGFYLVDGLTLDTLISSPFNSTPGTTKIGQVSHTFKHQGGAQPLLLYKFYELEDEKGRIKECRSVLDTVINLSYRPNVDVTANPVCARNEKVTLNNNTTIQEGSIESYTWYIGNDVYEEINPTVTFPEGGNYPFVVKTVTDTGCVAFDTIINIYVKHTPTAKFNIDGDIIEAFTVLDFIDLSIYDGSPADSSWYDYGDGTKEIGFNTSHTYDEVKIYQVEHVVKNLEGCKDTVRGPADLNTYLDIPNAFSPNGDNNNDELGLIYKAIYELYEYKIYNRWGQVVFDGGSDLSQTWDGTFNGELQPFGVYIVHVKALGAYGIEHNIKKNITLIK